jgi:iron-sulfur cluster insertion protein
MAGEQLSDARLRVKVIGGGCAGFEYDISFDERTELDAEGNEVKLSVAATDSISQTDVKLTQHGVTIVIDEMSLMYIRGTTIDYVDTLQGAGFKFNNPNVKSTCGCGQSFST